MRRLIRPVRRDQMTKDKTTSQKDGKIIAHFGTIQVGGKGPGTYSGGVVKLWATPKQDLLDSATSFLKAADRCLNSCKVEEGVEMLTVPGTVCASLSCELFLKFIILAETGEAVKGHHLLDLFKKCPKDIQFALLERNSGIVDVLERNNSQFVEARYHHEKEIFSFCQPELLQTAELLSEYVAERLSKKNA